VGRWLGSALLTLCALRPAPAQAQAVPAAAPEVATDESASRYNRLQNEFRFGSYGRVVAGGDMRGGGVDDVNVVMFGPRVREAPYLELDFQYDLITPDGALFRTWVTAAVEDASFHLDGDFDGRVALRNAFVEASRFGVEGLSVWAGSRMYRGDDIYLLNFWPMDNLNTVGGGIRQQIGRAMAFSVHGGANQLADPLQLQFVPVPAPRFGTEDMLLNDRVRPLVSAKWEHLFFDVAPNLSLKYVLWGEWQRLGEGEWEDDNQVRIPLPAEQGWAVGAQLGAWGFAPRSFANLFFRHARGLSSLGELAIPRNGLARDRTFNAASVTRVATSFNVEQSYGALMGGAYVQWVQDASDLQFNPEDFTEGVVSLRPIAFITEHFHQAFEISYQRRTPQGLSPRTGTFVEPSVWEFSVMPTLSLDRGSYSRPQLRLIWSTALLGDGALARWPADDPRAQHRAHHFLGVGAEWWFNSFTYASP
jgi:maltoporin